MSISSISNNLSFLLVNAYSNTALSSAKTSDDSSQSTAKSLTGVVATNSDGDTFQLSQTARLSASGMYSKMDADGDGSVTEEEFVSARPSDVTEEMAANLFSSFDTDSTESVSSSEFETAMNNAPLPPPTAASGGSSSSTDSQSFSDLDTNQDGVVSAAELAAARPEDVSEEMAAQLFQSFDSDGSGGLTEAEYTAAMGNTAGVGSV